MHAIYACKQRLIHEQRCCFRSIIQTQIESVSMCEQNAIPTKAHAKILHLFIQQTLTHIHNSISELAWAFVIIVMFRWLKISNLNYAPLNVFVIRHSVMNNLNFANKYFMCWVAATAIQRYIRVYRQHRAGAASHLPYLLHNTHISIFNTVWVCIVMYRNAEWI